MTPHDPDALHDQATIELNEFFPFRLAVTQLAVTRSLAEIYKERYEITRTEWRVLALLGEQQPLCAQDICARSLMDKVPVSRAIARLVKLNLLHKEKDPDDGRSQLLRFTDKGAQAYGEIVPEVRKRAREIFSCFNAEEQKQFRGLLDRLQAAASQASEDI